MMYKRFPNVYIWIPASHYLKFSKQAMSDNETVLSTHILTIRAQNQTPAYYKIIVFSEYVDNTNFVEKSQNLSQPLKNTSLRNYSKIIVQEEKEKQKILA